MGKNVTIKVNVQKKTCITALFRKQYRKPPDISPGLIFVRKHFLVGHWAYNIRGLYTDKILC